MVAETAAARDPMAKVCTMDRRLFLSSAPASSFASSFNCHVVVVHRGGGGDYDDDDYDEDDGCGDG